jgi:N-acetylglucosamine-6-phosphate deacetylase
MCEEFLEIYWASQSSSDAFDSPKLLLFSCTLGEALKCATFNPAKCLGIEKRKGTLRPGADADLIVMDWEGNVRRTWVRGKEVWTQRV